MIPTWPGVTAKEFTDAMYEWAQTPEFREMHAFWRLAVFLTADDALLQELIDGTKTKDGAGWKGNLLFWMSFGFGWILVMMLILGFG